MKKTILLIVTFVLFAFVANAQVAVITNKGVSDSKINSAKAADIYKIEIQKWGNGTPIKVFILKGDASNAKFYSGIGVSEKKLKKVWLKKKLTGEGTPPTVVGSVGEMIKKVSSTTGAIGYIPKGKVTGDVKVILDL